MLHPVWHLKSRDNIKFCHMDHAYKTSKANGQQLGTQEPILNGLQGNFEQCWEILQFEKSSVEDKSF